MITQDSNDWWKGATIYQVYPRSFNDSNGDGIGDINGITEKLPYLADLGIDAVWISPFFKSPQKDFGYDISDYCDIDPQFGTLDDFDRMVAEAHKLDLKIIIDQVYSHTSDEHAWFEESRKDKINAKADWYVWADPKPDGSAPNNWLSYFGGIAWKFDPARKQYYLHNFVEGQPDLNVHNPEVQEALLDAARFWLNRGVDGFRMDAIGMSFHDQQLRDNPPNPAGFGSHDTHDWQLMTYTCDRPEMDGWMQRIRAVLDEYPGTTSVGELTDIDIIARYTGQYRGLHMGYSFELMDNPFSKQLLIDTFTKAKNDLGNGWLCQALGNHDRKRVVTRWVLEGAERADKAKLYAAMLATMRGAVCIYQGEELGLEEAVLEFKDLVDPWGLSTWPEDQGRDGCRTPIPWEADKEHGGFSTGKPWLPMQSFHLPLAVDQQEQDQQSTLKFYQSLLRWRKEYLSCITGDLDIIDMPGEVLGYRRTDDQGQSLTCLFNLGMEPMMVILPNEPGEVVTPAGFSSSVSGTEVTLPALQAAIVIN